MADLSVAVSQELLHLLEQLTVPTRFYFPSSGSADVSPSFDSAWVETAAAVRRKLISDGKKIASAAASVTVTSTTTNPEKHLHAQYISKPLRAQTLAGNIRGQFRALESAAAFNGTLQIGVRVVSLDGSTVRATLLSVGGTVTTSTTPPEFTTSLTNRRLLTSGDVTPLPLSSYTCQDGDRLVIEIGCADKDAGAARTAGISFGDNTVDLPENDTTTTAQDPWVEFDSTIQFQTAVENVHIQDSGTIQRQDTGWVRIADSVTAQISAGSDLNVVLTQGEVLHLAETVTPSEGLVAVVTSEAVHVQDTVSTSSILTVTIAGEAVKLSESSQQTIDPEVTAPSESLKIADSVTAMIVLLANLQETVKLSEFHQGSGTQLVGVVHITDGPPSAALIAASGLAAAIGDETLHLQESLTVSRGLTATPGESLKIADTVTALPDGVVSLTESLKIADTPLETLDPLQAAPQESLKCSELAIGLPTLLEPLSVVDTVIAAIASNDRFAALADETLHLGESVSTARTLETSASESIRIADALSLDVVIQASLTEALKLSDGPVSGYLDPIQQIVLEPMRLADGPVVGATTGLQVLVAQEIVKMADRVIILSASIAENLTLSDTGRGLTSLVGTLKISDTVQAQLGTILSAGPTETLHLADAVAIVRSPLEVTLTETLSLQYVSSEVEYTQDEYLRFQETVFVSLSAQGDLSTGLTDVLKLADTPAANRTLEVLVAAEVAHLAETIADVERTIEATVSESLKIAESLAVARDLTASVTGEALHLVEGPSVGRLDPIQQAISEALDLDDSALQVNRANPNDLNVGMSDEVWHLAETVQPQAGLVVVLAESVRLTEILDQGFSQPITAVVAETIHVRDVTAPAITPVNGPVDSEDVSVGEELAAALALVLVVDPETFRIAVQHPPQVGLDLATDTNNGPQVLTPDPSWNCIVPFDDWDVLIPYDDWNVVVL